MNFRLRFCILNLGLWACLVSTGLRADEPAYSSDLNTRFPAGSIQSQEQADSALDAVQKEKQRTEQDYKNRQHACYEKFLVTPCLEDEKLNHQKSVSVISAVELEANRYRRQKKVEDIEQKRRNDEAERLRNAPQEAVRRQQYQRDTLQKQADKEQQDAAHAKDQERKLSAPTPAPKQARTVVNNPEQRQLNAQKQREKIADAAERREQTAKRRAKNEADRQRKAQEQQAKQLASPPPQQ